MNSVASPLIQHREEGSHENTKDETLIEFRVFAISWLSVVVPNQAIVRFLRTSA